MKSCWPNCINTYRYSYCCDYKPYDLITDVDIVRQRTDYHLFQLQEHFNATRNKIENLGDELANLSALRTLNCRHNRLVDEGIPKDVFSLEDLQVVV